VILPPARLPALFISSCPGARRGPPAVTGGTMKPILPVGDSASRVAPAVASLSQP